MRRNYYIVRMLAQPLSLRAQWCVGWCVSSDDGRIDSTARCGAGMTQAASVVSAKLGLMSSSRSNFIAQQGVEGVTGAACLPKYHALMFQPRLIGLFVLAAVVLQAAPLFLALSIILFWSALVPQANPFDQAYNRFVASRNGLPPLAPAPPPRRFAQGMAAVFALLIGVSLIAGWLLAAVILELLLLAALTALIFFGFCLGSFVYHVITGRAAFAKRTLPWGRGA
jgi:hypothetical protein